MTAQPQQFCVRWNSYHTNLQAVFPRLLLTEQFADVTLACESKQLRCHKVVLSACSGYLERLLVQNPCKHPIVLIKDMRFSELQALVDFMYKGEVNVTQEELPSLLKSAEALQIRGLCSSDNGGLTPELGSKTDTKDFSVASEALMARHSPSNGTSQTKPIISSPTTNGPKKRKSCETERTEVKEETVEEDGLYYGELDQDNMEYNEDDDTGKAGSSLGQTSGRQHPYIRVKPENELFFQTKLQNLAKANTDYINRLSKMNPREMQKEFAKYGFNTNINDDTVQKNLEKSENDYYKSWLEQNGELEVSLMKASQLKKPKFDPKTHKDEVELIPKPKDTTKEIFPKYGEKSQIRRRGRPPVFKDKNVDIGDTVLKADLDQFLEGKEVSSSGLSRKDLERVMMGKFNPNRRYSNEAMWAALMDVKRGGSIYRAAQTHKVPRKSLRNWMKRCHIKSSFPMPQQLKQFVENSKKQKEFTKNYETYPELPTDAQNYEKTDAELTYDPDMDFDFAIANVQCQYDSGSDTTDEASDTTVRHDTTKVRHDTTTVRHDTTTVRHDTTTNGPLPDHTYDTRDEPPAFIIHQVSSASLSAQSQFSDAKVMTLMPSTAASINIIHVGDRGQEPQTNQQQEYNKFMCKRVRRSEKVLLQAADCVSRGSTFQTVSEQFNIPISTIRFFMARKGILPRRKRGRSTQVRACGSPEPPFHMQHFKLPDMLALQDESS